VVPSAAPAREQPPTATQSRDTTADEKCDNGDTDEPTGTNLRLVHIATGDDSAAQRAAGDVHATRNRRSGGRGHHFQRLLTLAGPVQQQLHTRQARDQDEQRTDQRPTPTADDHIFNGADQRRQHHREHNCDASSVLAHPLRDRTLAIS
jgi:hypothetical protein